MSRLRILPALLVFLAAARADSDFKTLVFQNGAASFNRVVEASLAQNTADTLNTDPALLCVQRAIDPQTGRETNTRSVLLRFDNLFGDAPGLIPKNAKITRAVLTLATAPADGSQSGARLCAHRMLLPWDASASWNSPAWNRDGVQPDDREAAFTPDGFNWFIKKDTPADLDVTASLRAWASGAPNHGWLLRHTSKTELPAAFVSSNAPATSRRPKLTVTFDTRPANRPPSASNFSEQRDPDGSATFSLRADDPDGDPLAISFFARKQPVADPDFEIILLPDTQYYARENHGAKASLFTAQTRWIVKNAQNRNIAAVLHLGDITDRGDIEESEWLNADHAMSLLEKAKSPRHPNGIPYSMNVGNHDQRDLGGGDGPARLFNEYFGVKRFSKRAYYGGHFGKTNNNHFILFEAGSEKFIAISLEYKRAAENPAVLKWASALLDKHADRRAIIVSHSMMSPGDGGAFTRPGRRLIKALAAKPNVFLFAGGHLSGAGFRTDIRNGNTVHSIVQDFQSDPCGGDTLLTVLHFSPRNAEIAVSVVNAARDQPVDYPNGSPRLKYKFAPEPPPWVKIKELKKIPSGSATSCRLENAAGSPWEWRAEISDPGKTTPTPTRPLP
jgi:hypothetical protein